MKPILVVLTVLVLTTTAEAAMLSLDRADRAADREARATVQAWQDEYDPESADWDDPGANLYIERYELDPCERVSRRSAECLVTYYLNDGDECDSEITVKATRKGRLHVREREYPDCVSEDQE